MKHKTKRMLRSVIALALTFALVFSTAGTAFATGSGTTPDSEAKKINYVSIGDSMANGYGFTGYHQNSNDRNSYDIMTGEGMYGEGAYPLQFEKYLTEKGYDVNHTKLATSAMLADDLLFLLDGREEFDDGWNGWRDYVGDDYSDAELKAHFQEAITNADVITMGLGNASFGAFMLDRVTSALGVFGASLEGEPELSLEAAVATMELDEEQHALVMEVYEELIAELVNKVPAELVEEYNLEQVTDIVSYVVASHVVGYKLVMDRIIEMNPDVEIVLVGLLNTTYGMNITDENGNVLVPFGDVMDNAFEAMNSYMAGLPTAMQAAGKWQDAKFYYAEQPAPKFICQEFKALSENGWVAEDARLNGDTVRSRNIDAFNSNLRYIMGAPFAAGINGGAYSVVKSMIIAQMGEGNFNNMTSEAQDALINETIDNYGLRITETKYGSGFVNFLPAINLEDVKAFENNPPTEFVENGNFNVDENRKNLSIALYLGIEHGVAQSTDTMEIPLEGLITIATNIESAFDGFETNLGSPVAVAEEMGDYLTSTDVLKGMCKIYGLFKVGNGMSVHPTPEGHDEIATSVINAYEAGYTATDKTVDDLKVLAGIVADLVAEYGDDAARYAYNYAEENGYIDMAKEALAELEAQLVILKAEAEKLHGQAKEEALKAIAEIEKAIAELNELLKAEAEAFTQELIAQINKQINIAKENLKELAEILVAEGTAAAKKAAEEAQAALEELAKVAAEQLQAALKEGADWLIEKAGEAYENFVNAVIEAVPAADKYLYDWFYNNPEKVIGFFAEYGDDFAKLAEEYGDEALIVLGIVAYEFGDDAVEFIMNNPEKALDALNDWYDKYGEKTWAMMDKYFEALGVYEAIDGAVGAAKDGIEAALTELYAQIDKYSKEAVEKIWSAVEGDKIVETLKAAVEQAEQLVADLEAMIDSIEKEIANLQAQLEQLKADLETANAQLKAEIEKQIAAIEDAIAKLEAQIAAIEKEIADLQEAIAKAEAAIKEIVNAAGATYEEIVAAFEAVMDAFEEIAGIVEDIEGFIAEAIEVIKALDAAVKDANAEIKAIVEAIEGIFGRELPAIDFAAIDEMIKEALAEGADYLAAKAEEAYNAFVEAAVAAIKEQAPKAAEFVYNWLVENPDVVIGFFAEYGDDMIDFIVDNQDAIMEALNWLVAEYGDEAAEFVMDNADVILAALVDFINEYGDEAWTMIEAYLTEMGALPVDTSMITEALDKLTGMIEGFGPAALGQLHKIAEGVADKLMTQLDKLEAEAKAAVDGFISQIEKQIAQLEAQLEQLKAQLDTANAELKAQLEKQIAQIEKQIASLKAQIAEIEALMNELYAAVKDAEAAVKDLVEAINNKAIGDIKEALKEIVVALDAVKDAIDYVSSVVDEINAVITDVIETIEAIEAAVKEIADAVAAVNAEAKATIEAIENTITTIKTTVNDTAEAINKYVEDTQAAIDKMYTDAIHGEYTVTEDSFYVALGDTTAEDSYAAKLAEALDMEDQFFDANIDGMRAEDLLYILDAEYEGDAYAQANFGEMVEDYRAVLTEELSKADLITLNFSNNTITEFMMNQTMAALDGNAAEMDWNQYLSDKEAALVEEALAEMTGYFVSTGLDAEMAAVLTTAVESYAYAYVGFAASCGDAVDAIKAINPDAQVVVVGMYNPFEGAVLTSGDVEIALGEYVGALVELCNIHYVANAMAEGGFVYVAAPDVEINKPFNKPVDAMEFLTGFVLDGTEALQPSDAGHEYIKEQILGALDITSKAAVKAEEAFKALDELGEITNENLDDAKAIVEAAREAYDALTQEEKEALGIEALDKLVEAEKAIAEIEIANAEAKNEEDKAVLDELRDKLEQAEIDLAEIERVLAVTNSKPAKVTVTNNKSTVKATWTAVEGADRYSVKLYRNGKKVGKTQYTSKTEIKFTNQLRGGKYKVVVAPYAKALGANYYGFEKASNVKQIKLLKPTVKATKVGKYTRIKAADQNSTGFQIYISKDKKFNKKDTLLTIKTDKKALNKKLSNKKYFKSGKTYIKVRAYSTINGKKVYGKWSNVKTIKR